MFIHKKRVYLLFSFGIFFCYCCLSNELKATYFDDLFCVMDIMCLFARERVQELMSLNYFRDTVHCSDCLDDFIFHCWRLGLK